MRAFLAALLSLASCSCAAAAAACEGQRAPLWPLALAKGSAPWEAKGRTASNSQWLGHVCAQRGAQSLCHVCAHAASNVSGGGGSCGGEVAGVLQLQGANWTALPAAAAVASDVPFAIGAAVAHRWDFAHAERACVMLQGGACIAPAGGAALPAGGAAACALRCWEGRGGALVAFSDAQTGSLAAAAPMAGVEGPGTRQGELFSLTTRADGDSALRRAHGIAVDDSGWVYTADTRRHTIHGLPPPTEASLSPQRAALLAGVPDTAGWRDGPALAALFSSPGGLALWCDSALHALRAARCLDGLATTASNTSASACTRLPRCAAPQLAVADTHNHRIRVLDITGGAVRTLAGGARWRHPHWWTPPLPRSGPLLLREPPPEQGYADGVGSAARFSAPLDIAADANGTAVFVADTGNALVRLIWANGTVETLAGGVMPAVQPGCRPPCLTGVTGGADGPARAGALFDSPRAIAIGPGAPYTLLLLDGNRVRMISRGRGSCGGAPCAPFAAAAAAAQPELAALRDVRTAATVGASGHAASALPEEIAALDTVLTLAGAHAPGSLDGTGEAARFDAPSGIAFSPDDGRIYVSETARCRVRRLSVAASAAQQLDCAARLVDILRPAGCGSSTDVGWRSARRVLGAMVLPPAALQPRRYRDAPLCVGVPPPARGWQLGGAPASAGGGTLAAPFLEDEDAQVDTSFVVWCPAACGVDAGLGAGVLGGSALNGSAADAGQPPLYADESALCASAVHSGVLANDTAGVLTVRVQRGTGPEALPGRQQALLGSLANGVLSAAIDSTPRTFRIDTFADPLHRLLVMTVAGAGADAAGRGAVDVPAACDSADGALPIGAELCGPIGLAVPPMTAPPFADASTGARARVLITDTCTAAADSISRIRALTAICTQRCENGGNCSAADTCTCAAGWAGFDCTRAVCPTPGACPARSICAGSVGGGGSASCVCLPGYGGPQCEQALCVQTCLHGGVCAAPDACACAPGWTDARCGTPVCSQTCGNGGSCVAPDTCACAALWGGADCRTPQCSQGCANGGLCIAPETCACPLAWSGPDCRAPVCSQGYFRPMAEVPANGTLLPALPQDLARRITSAATPAALGDAAAEPTWLQFTPCEYAAWCSATSEFACLQLQLAVEAVPLDGACNVTGACDAFSSSGSGSSSSNASVLARHPPPHQLYERWRHDHRHPHPHHRQPAASSQPAGGDASASASAAARRLCATFELAATPPPSTPFRYEDAAGALSPGLHRVTPARPFGWDAAGRPWAAPAAAASDRTLAHGQLARLPQGRYVCANGGSCVAPETCECAAGWGGFDCRTPLCRQGFYYPAVPAAGLPAGQGSYVVSGRALTVWESPATPAGKFAAYVHEHPNFHSALEDMALHGLPTTHLLTDGLGDDTNEGWRRTPWWVRLPGARWQHGRFAPSFTRTCAGSAAKTAAAAAAMRRAPAAAGGAADAVADTRAAFAAVYTANDSAIYDEPSGGAARWREAGGECIDTVNLGCFNGGTCADAGRCACAAGWEGDDCSLPICAQSVAEVAGGDGDPTPRTLLLRGGGGGGGGGNASSASPARWVAYRRCANGGNCTRPGECACEKGWSGAACDIPLCAQECFRGGACYAPDACACVADTASAFTDARGEPLYANPDGSAQLTGWTGFDCNTPICVQGTWLPIVASPAAAAAAAAAGRTALVASDNSGRSFQAGCAAPADGGRYMPPNRTRLSPWLCDVAVWQEGSYAAPWRNALGDSVASPGRAPRVNTLALIDDGLGRGDGGTVLGPLISGEGIYACANAGSCVAPDVCECAAGWSGRDCATPNCSFAAAPRAAAAAAAAARPHGCMHAGICTAPDTCVCPTAPSLLPALSALVPPGSLTGWAGRDCSVARCAQGVFDASCVLPPALLLAGLNASDRSALAPLAGQGCYRCANGGNCSAPDTCECAAGWSGFDCRVPSCTLYDAPADVIAALQPYNADAVRAFEADPCGETRLVSAQASAAAGNASAAAADSSDALVPAGTCVGPGVCSCLCRVRGQRDASGALLETPYHDPLGGSAPLGYVWGTGDCLDGFEGLRGASGAFRSCHLQIVVPSWWDLNKVKFIATASTAAVISCVVLVLLVLLIRRWAALRRRMQRRRLRKVRDAEDRYHADVAAGRVPPPPPPSAPTTARLQVPRSSPPSQAGRRLAEGAREAAGAAAGAAETAATAGEEPSLFDAAVSMWGRSRSRRRVAPSPVAVAAASAGAAAGGAGLWRQHATAALRGSTSRQHAPRYSPQQPVYEAWPARDGPPAGPPPSAPT